MDALSHRNPLNLLRGVAVLMVIGHHFQHYLKTNLEPIGTYGGLLGVQLFFLISGYLIVISASRHDFFKFMRGRALRIFPAYWFVLLLASIFYNPVLPYASEDAPYFWINFFSLTHFVPFALVKFDVLTVAWTLTIEWTWYFIAPLLLAVASASWVNARLGKWFWALALLGAFFIQMLWYFSVKSGVLDPLFASSIAQIGISPINDHMRIAFMYSAAPSQWVFFVLGAALWFYQDTLKRVPASIWFLVACAILGFPILWPLGLGLSPSVLSGLGLAALFLTSLQCAKALNNKLLLPLHWIGDWSFPLYLLHVPVMLTLAKHFQMSSYLGLMVCLLISILLAGMVHFLVELPFRRLHRNSL